MTVTIAQYDKLEFDLIAALADLPASQEGLRPRALEVLEKLRSQKRALLARSPDVLRKSSARRTPAQPSWRGLPVDTIAVDTMVKEARSRGVEEQRLAKAFRRQAVGNVTQAELAALKGAMRRPIVGDRAFLGFFSQRAGR
jgi:hypothetical protein